MPVARAARSGFGECGPNIMASGPSPIVLCAHGSAPHPARSRVTALRARVSIRRYSCARQARTSREIGAMLCQHHRQFAVDCVIGDRENMACELDIVEGGTAQPHQPRHQRLRSG